MGRNKKAAKPALKKEKSSDLKPIDGDIDKEVVEVSIPVIATPRESLIFKIKGLNRDIEALEPHSEAWNDILQQIGDLKRQLDRL